MRRAILALGPATIPFAWLLAGQWHTAGAEQRAWFQLTSALCLVSLIPIRAAGRSSYGIAAIIRIWAWGTIAGLLVMS